MAMPLAATTAVHTRGRASHRSTTGRRARTAPNCHTARATMAKDGGKVFVRPPSTPPTIEPGYPNAVVSTTRAPMPAAAASTATRRDRDQVAADPARQATPSWWANSHTRPRLSHPTIGTP